MVLALRFILVWASVASTAVLAAPDDCGWEDGALTHGRRDRNVVALTFDACPTTHMPPFVDGVLEVLERGAVPATVFVSGRWAEQNPDDFARLHGAKGIEIGLHGYRHRTLLDRSPEVTDDEIVRGDEALRALGAKPAPLFRPPFGDAPAWLAARSGAAGVTPVLWEVVSGDPDPRFSARLITRVVVGDARPGSIIIMHINGRGEKTAEALPAVIDGLRAKGLGFTTVGAMLRECRP